MPQALSYLYELLEIDSWLRANQKDAGNSTRECLKFATIALID
ncbi:MAG: hypothetical protein QNJ74_18760 [Trichodesmium sp. MO_231.B1]|nr:hypothetical protein [Trichodesmium sp. MO_231.B1]